MRKKDEYCRGMQYSFCGWHYTPPDYGIWDLNISYPHRFHSVIIVTGSLGLAATHLLFTDQLFYHWPQGGEQFARQNSVSGSMSSLANILNPDLTAVSQEQSNERQGLQGGPVQRTQGNRECILWSSSWRRIGKEPLEHEGLK